MCIRDSPMGMSLLNLLWPKISKHPMGMSLLNLLWPKMARNPKGNLLLKLLWPKMARNPKGNLLLKLVWPKMARNTILAHVIKIGYCHWRNQLIENPVAIDEISLAIATAVFTRTVAIDVLCLESYYQKPREERRRKIFNK